MKKFQKDQKRNFFIGICNSCGELYEASSAVEDLEGLTFECKKMLCSGRVVLQYAKSAAKDAIESAPLDNKSKGDDDPRRYC